MDHRDPVPGHSRLRRRGPPLRYWLTVSERSGEVATTFAGMAETAGDFITGSASTEVDLLGWRSAGWPVRIA